MGRLSARVIRLETSGGPARAAFDRLLAEMTNRELETFISICQLGDSPADRAEAARLRNAMGWARARWDIFDAASAIEAARMAGDQPEKHP